jgi:hypothetical protein
VKRNDELKYYLKMIERYQGNLKEGEKIESIGFNTLTRLMLYLKLTGNKELIKNLLIILLALYMDIPPDNFNKIGLPLNKLSPQDKNALYSELKQELTLN